MLTEEEIKKNKKLNAKQMKFVSEYVIDFNATQAAIRTGYSKATAGSIASENLQKPEIKTAINELLSQIISDNKEIAVKVIRECQKIAFANMADFLEYTNDSLTLKPSDQVDTAALESIYFDEVVTEKGDTVTKKRIVLHDKKKALEILAKYTGLYKDIALNVNVYKIQKEIEDVFNAEKESNRKPD